MTEPAASPADGRASRWPSAVRAVAIVVVGALVIGGATSFAQGLLPGWAASFANSAGSWTLLSFGLLWWCRARVNLSAVLGIIGFVLLLEGYAIVSTWRGFPYHLGPSNPFTLIAVVAGPFIGAAASLARASTRPAVRGVAGAVPSAVLVGEGVYGLTVIADSTSPVYWSVQLIVGAALATGLALRGSSKVRTLAWSVGALLVGAAAFYFLYAFVL
jgi:hypothetical protein